MGGTLLGLGRGRCLCRSPTLKLADRGAHPPSVLLPNLSRILQASSPEGKGLLAVGVQREGLGREERRAGAGNLAREGVVAEISPIFLEPPSLSLALDGGEAD